MANKTYEYQYETSPRKIDENYSKKTNKSKTKSKIKSKKVNPKSDLKSEKRLKAKLNFFLVVKFVLLFAILFLILFRNSQISAKFAEIQGLKSELTTLRKENDQLEINIQNSLNLNNVELEAKERLGMQKLSSKQTVYINLPKKDYVEHRTEEVIIEEEKNWFENLIDKVKEMF